MQLQYLEFDFTDEESGRGSLDAMASVRLERLPALLAEISAVLRWAGQTFGPAGVQDDGEWGYELQGTLEPDLPLRVVYDEHRSEIAISPTPAEPHRVTLTLTLAGTPSFCQAFRERFEVGA
ncbi:hypothetical protein GCM10027034_30470 [Ramlibacter solisilvae]|uniref:Uncharacterized protein n=1 Tax=Ramlibacter tataouinensis TaxID=94132 RepID=A0A127JRV3_9BURK|nr:hypothetical protein [Ramlibacter tataouinensis]AMO22613.1 hypothetical protein UC35_06610 [Ramlibacter tataouinensis]